MDPYARVDLTLWPLQSRPKHVYYGQPYARVDFIPQSGTLDVASEVIWRSISKARFQISVADPHHIDADLDPSFRLDADLYPASLRADQRPNPKSLTGGQSRIWHKGEPLPKRDG